MTLASEPAGNVEERNFRILSLDGGGSKGVYSIGVLKEFEKAFGAPLSKRFDLICGTSTGAIIGALIAMGKGMEEVERLYMALIPQVMRRRWRHTRTGALRQSVHAVFGNSTFSDFQTRTMIVATNYERDRPLVFKSHADQAYQLSASFQPGFGCTVAEAIMCSAAAFPFFAKSAAHTANQGIVTAIDGGFCANNPTLLAIADADTKLGIRHDRMVVLSVGVGHYKEPNKSVFHRVLFSYWPFELIPRMLDTNSNTIDILRIILVPDVKCIRVDESFPDDQYATDLLESDPAKLKKILSLGRESFGRHEPAIRQHFS